MEIIDVIDPVTGSVTGQQEGIVDIHKKGLWHRTVHIWLTNSDKDVLVQKRGIGKHVLMFPGMWDISAAGHVSAGETSIEAAQTESGQELGLYIWKKEFERIGQIKREVAYNIYDDGNESIDREIQDIYIIRRDISVETLREILGSYEVSDVRWISLEDFKHWIKEPKDLVPREEEFQILINHLENSS